MTLLLIALLGALVLGLLFGGSLGRLNRPPVGRLGMLLFTGLSQGMAMLAHSVGVMLMWQVACAGAAVLFFFNNRGRPGLILYAAGLTLNTLSAALNMGMPMSVEAATRAGLDTSVAELNASHVSEPLDDSTVAPWLTQTIPVPVAHLPSVASVGDVMAAAGLGVFMFTGLTGKGRSIPKTPKEEKAEKKAKRALRRQARLDEETADAESRAEVESMDDAIGAVEVADPRSSPSVRTGRRGRDKKSAGSTAPTPDQAGEERARVLVGAGPAGLRAGTSAIPLIGAPDSVTAGSGRAGKARSDRKAGRAGEHGANAGQNGKGQGKNKTGTNKNGKNKGGGGGAGKRRGKTDPAQLSDGVSTASPVIAAGPGAGGIAGASASVVPTSTPTPASTTESHSAAAHAAPPASGVAGDAAIATASAQVSPELKPESAAIGAAADGVISPNASSPAAAATQIAASPVRDNPVSSSATRSGPRSGTRRRVNQPNHRPRHTAPASHAAPTDDAGPAALPSAATDSGTKDAPAGDIDQQPDVPGSSDNSAPVEPNEQPAVSRTEG